MPSHAFHADYAAIDIVGQWRCWIRKATKPLTLTLGMQSTPEVTHAGSQVQHQYDDWSSPTNCSDDISTGIYPAS